jgi:hypothetical protein
MPERRVNLLGRPRDDDSFARAPAIAPGAEHLVPYHLLVDGEAVVQMVGLAQVVQVNREFNSYEMSEVLGQQRSDWGL